jgi:nitroimidazol reductase NimA-like FMN-containing flavoprotein (pyridoxamine 5'-phosphate oxidase superfamily)
MNELEVLSEEQCLELLHRHDLGRIAFLGPDGPEILPVNYGMLDDREIVIRTAPGAKVRWAPMTAVAFEVEGTDLTRFGLWSVMAQGVAAEITTALDPTSVAARRVDVRPLAPGDRHRALAIRIGRLSGRRFPIEVHET